MTCDNLPPPVSESKACVAAALTFAALRVRIERSDRDGFWYEPPELARVWAESGWTK